MGLILLEALLALVLLLAIVWWTMFAGRRKGEPPATVDTPRSDSTRNHVPRDGSGDNTGDDRH